MKIMTILIAMLFILYLGCTDDSPLTPEKDMIVVRGYVYANEPVTDIQITSTLPLGNEETSAPPINQATVLLVKEGKEYSLTPSAGDSGYYHYPGDDLHIETGDELTIQVTHEDHFVTGQTVVPPAPEQVSISKTELSFPDFEQMWQLRQQGVSMDSIRRMTTAEVTWQQEEGALYFVHVENIEENPDPIEQTQFRRPPRLFISHPVPVNRYMINAMMMTHMGRHVVRVYRINQEYADLYESRRQDSRDLNEPLSNINNGLGVFSAFNSTSVYFEFVQN